VNQTEAETVFGLATETLEKEPAAWTAALAEKKVQTLIITRGSQSTLTFHHHQFEAVNAHPVTPVDTVGAGDTFAGVFAAQHHSGKPFIEAVRWANVAGALATLKPGAQEGIPMAGDVTQAIAAVDE
jgi:ribokinase